jgi:hypothetical protein
MPKVVYTAGKGLVQETGSGIQFDEMPFSPVQPVTTTGTAIRTPGVYTVTGGSPLVVVVPAPSSIPGGTVIVRSLSAQAHALTGSSESAGINIFRSSPMTTANITGQKFTFAATIGETVTLISDGRAYCVAAGSGSISTP